ncbi:60S ribosomal export protein NMD3, partial [Patescibacteria group bacterium]|nr:60S ribosomal export protein NMD3 [Patescibacteria group bacterium]
MFCPKCGKKGGGLCFSCALEEHPIRFGKLCLEVCGCGSVRRGREWVSGLENVLESVTLGLVGFPPGVSVRGVKVSSVERGKKVKWDASFRLTYCGEEHVEVVHCRVDVAGKTCPSCGKKSARYYEAILQVRENPPLFVP